MPEASRRVSVREMANLIDPRVTKALLALLGDESYVVAAEAAKSLRTHPGTQVTAALVGVYGDSSHDVAVRTQAGKSLYSRKDPSAVGALIDLLERAVATDDLGLLRSTGNILRRTTGQRIENDPAAWRAWQKREG
jgi:HEAT repeat protein